MMSKKLLEVLQDLRKSKEDFGFSPEEFPKKLPEDPGAVKVIMANFKLKYLILHMIMEFIVEPKKELTLFQICDYFIELIKE